MIKVIVAGIRLKESEQEFVSLLAETAALCNACGYQPVCTITQNSRSMDPDTAFRKGKALELKAAVAETGAEKVVFYNSLPLAAAFRLAAIVGADVIDRTALILNIFSQRARTKQAQLQTELARLRYDLPSVKEENEESSHQRGGSATNRGEGEMRSSLIQRKYRRRIAEIEKHLAAMEAQRLTDERRRAKTSVKRCALVGYTNAGKSSLMNVILEMTAAKGSRVREKDMLFETLDTSVRMVRYGQKAFYLYDTVGFVSNLPHMLVDAFRSTLAAAADADLLIEVIDASDSEHEAKSLVTRDTLNQIGAGHVPLIRVYNKVDLLDDMPKEGMLISCRTKRGIEMLLNRIVYTLYPEEAEMTCFIPYSLFSALSKQRTRVSVDVQEYTDDGMIVKIAGEKKIVNAFGRYQI
ncbi:MAG: GTPase HflX [Solobacterium sp.]|nr:GTPase HflX [Solobacterium sp.]